MIPLACAVWIGVAAFAWKSRRAYLQYPEMRPAGKTIGANELSIVIPARNEEANIAGALAGLRGFDTVVVDDHSEDATAEVAGRSGATVIPAHPLAAGWLGKPNACVTGAAHSAAEWLLFLDADTAVTPALPSALIAHAKTNRLDMLSAFLRQDCVSFSERALIPYAFALYFCGVSSDSVLANGQCLLVRREAYERIGGHSAVAGSVIEDVALANAFRRAGFACGIVRAGQLGSVRMYRSFAEIWRGFEKNSFRFLLADYATGIQVIAASILLTSWVPLSIAALAEGRGIVAIAAVLLPVIAFRSWYRSWWDAVLVLPAIGLFQAVALNAMAATLMRRRTLWKGRAIA